MFLKTETQDYQISGENLFFVREIKLSLMPVINLELAILIHFLYKSCLRTLFLTRVCE